MPAACICPIIAGMPPIPPAICPIICCCIAAIPPIIAGIPGIPGWAPIIAAFCIIPGIICCCIIR